MQGWELVVEQFGASDSGDVVGADRDIASRIYFRSGLGLLDSWVNL